MSAVSTTSRPVEASLAEALSDLRQRPYIQVDIETSGLDPATDDWLLITIDEYVFSARDLERSPEARRAVASLLEDPDLVKVIFNAAFDSMWFQRHGIRPRRVVDPMLGLMLLDAGIARPRGWYTLAQTLERELSIRIDKSLQASFAGADPATFVPTDEQLRYCLLDTRYLGRLARAVGERVKAAGLSKTWSLENDQTQVIASQQLYGMPIDLQAYSDLCARKEAEYAACLNRIQALLGPHYLNAAYREFHAKLDAYEAWERGFQHAAEMIEHESDGQAFSSKLERRRWIQARERAWKDAHPKPVKPRPPDLLVVTSHQQVVLALKELGIVLPDLKRKTLLRARSSVQGDGREVLGLLAEASKLQKFLSTYGDRLLQRISPDGRLRSHFTQIKATGRISSSMFRDEDSDEEWGANLQNVHPELKALVKAPAGRTFVIADFSQVELRIAAELALRQNTQSQDRLVHALLGGRDPHSATGALLAGLPEETFLERIRHGDAEAQRYRKAAKIVNFGTIYGISARSLADQLVDDTRMVTEEDVRRAERFLAAFWAGNPDLKAALEAYGRQALERGYTRTLGGRLRRYPNPCPPELRHRVVRQAMNHPIQGTSADITKLSGNLVFDRLPPGAFIWNAVHDELCVECDAPDGERVATIVDAACQEAYRTVVRQVPCLVSVQVSSTWQH